jgi:hypothetical protein
MEDYQWIKQVGQRFRVTQVVPRSDADPSYVLYYVDLVQEPGDRPVRMECQTSTSPDLNIQDVVVVRGSDATAVNVERERDGARWQLVIPGY